MSHLQLRIGTPGPDGRVPLTLIDTGGQETPGVLDATRLTGPWTLDEIHKKLNDPTDRQQAEAIGRGLFDRLFEAGSAIRQAWDALSLAQRTLPLELLIEPDPRDADGGDRADDHEDEAGYRPLRGYPWELLWDASNRKHARVGGLVRRADAPAITTPTSEWPFRILIIVGVDEASEDPANRIGATEEIREVRRALADFGRTIDILVLPTPARVAPPGVTDELKKGVQEVLRSFKPHVLHFIGHGTYDQGRKRHALLIEDPATTWSWTSSQIEEDLTLAECVPRLVLLNCCRSASERASSLSLQAALSTFGVPAVIAMQADVRGDRAAQFSKAFYGSALVGTPGDDSLPRVIDAVREARRNLGAEDEFDWGLPTLTLCSGVPLDQVLTSRRQWPDDPDFRTCREFDDARVYADASEPRRRMIEWFYPVKTRREPNILVLRGPAGSGRTRLLHWCMESWAADNPRQRYLRVDIPRGRNCLEWLIRLRAGTMSKERADGDRFLKQPLDLAPFLPFYAAVARAAKLPVGDAPGAVAAHAPRIDGFEHEVTDDVPLGPLCTAFLEGLRQVGRIVIVFDQLSITSIDPRLFAGFRDSFLVPIGDPAQSDVRVALAVTTDDYRDFGLAGLNEKAARVVDVKADQTLDQLEELAVEALRYRGRDTVKQLANIYLTRPNPKRAGLGRLFFCQGLVEEMPEFQDLGRMK